MITKVINKILLVIIVALLWSIYMIDNKISKYDIYFFDNYNVHEIISLVPYLIILLTIVLLILFYYTNIKRAVTKKNLLIFIFILFLLIYQIYSILTPPYKTVVTTIADIKNINNTTNYLTIIQDGQEIEIHFPDFMREMIEENRKYFIIYETSNKNHSSGTLYKISLYSPKKGIHINKN